MLDDRLSLIMQPVASRMLTSLHVYLLHSASCRAVHGGEYGVDLLLGGLLGELVVPARHMMGTLAGCTMVLHRAQGTP